MSWSDIDLSALPPPTVIETLNFETVLAALKADLVVRAPDLSPVLDLESEPLVKLLEVVAYRELVLRARINTAGRATMMAYATGTDLENLAVNLGVTRLNGEGDVALRARAVLAPEGWSVAGPKGAYVFHGLSAHPDVADVEVTSPTPAQVSVRVLAKAGDPAPAVLNAVMLALNDSSIRPIGDRVTVSAATRVVYDVTAQLVLGAGADAGLVRAQADTNLRAYAVDRRKIGRKVSRAGIIGALMSAGCEDVVLTSPDNDVAGTAGVAGELGNVVLT
jgi:phage-related baseplate assembly protein